MAIEFGLLDQFKAAIHRFSDVTQAIPLIFDFNDAQAKRRRRPVPGTRTRLACSQLPPT